MLLRDFTCKHLLLPNQLAVDADDFVCLKMRGLPFAAAAEDIVQFFHGLEIIQDSVKFSCFEDGRRTGVAAVLFASSDAALHAMDQKQGQNIGHRWIEIKVHRYDEWLAFGKE